jgi:hypothetical protein
MCRHRRGPCYRRTPRRSRVVGRPLLHPHDDLCGLSHGHDLPDRLAPPQDPPLWHPPSHEQTPTMQMPRSYSGLDHWTPSAQAGIYPVEPRGEKAQGEGTVDQRCRAQALCREDPSMHRPCRCKDEAPHLRRTHLRAGTRGAHGRPWPTPCGLPWWAERGKTEDSWYWTPTRQPSRAETLGTRSYLHGPLVGLCCRPRPGCRLLRPWRGCQRSGQQAHDGSRWLQSALGPTGHSAREGNISGCSL